MSELTTFDRWPTELRQKRGLLNGKRVQMAREVRGMARWQLARKLGISTVDLVQLEWNWGFWQPEQAARLARITDFPLAFFAADDPPYPFTAPTFMCGHDEEGNDWCEVIEP
jgi:hypothetical protein